MSRRKPRPRKAAQGSVVLRANGSLRVPVDVGIGALGGEVVSGEDFVFEGGEGAVRGGIVETREPTRLIE